MYSHPYIWSVLFPSQTDIGSGMEAMKSYIFYTLKDIQHLCQKFQSYLQTWKRAWNTKEFKINQKNYTTNYVWGRIQLTYTLSPFGIVELPSISPPWQVLELKKEKGISIKIYLVTNLLVGPHRFLLLPGFHDFSLVYRKFGFTLYCTLSYRVGPEVLTDSSLIIYLCCP